MATLPIIPRNDGEGSLGIETKQWGDVQTKKINGVDIETLFNYDDNGHQLKLNKNSESDTASILYQSNWTGYAEIGLTGNNDFSFKVSDGNNWFTAITIDRNTGEVEFPETNINSTGSDLYMYFNFDNYAM